MNFSTVAPAAQIYLLAVRVQRSFCHLTTFIFPDPPPGPREERHQSLAWIISLMGFPYDRSPVWLFSWSWSTRRHARTLKTLSCSHARIASQPSMLTFLFRTDWSQQRHPFFCFLSADYRCLQLLETVFTPGSFQPWKQTQSALKSAHIVTLQKD